MASLKRQAPGIQQTLPGARSVRHRGSSNDSGTHHVAPSPVDDSYAKHLHYVNQHKIGTAAWNSDWEVVWFSPGSIRNKELKEGASFFRHKACGGETTCTKLPRSNSNHVCAEVNLNLPELF